MTEVLCILERINKEACREDGLSCLELGQKLILRPAKMSPGGFGEPMDVFLGTDLTNQEELSLCIAKRSKRRDVDSGRKPLLPEYELMANEIKGALDDKGIRHAPYAYAYGKTVDDNCEVLIMQRVEGLSLSSAFTTGGLLRGTADHLNSQQTLTIGLLITEACGSLYKRGVIHRDLQPANIVLQYDTEKNSPTNAVLIDFGQSVCHSTESSGYGNERGGQENYGSYEMFSKPGDDIYPYRKYATVDLYSIGAILYHLRTGSVPPAIKERTDSSRAIYRQPLSLDFGNRTTKLSPQDVMLEELITALTKYHPKERVHFGVGINDDSFNPDQFALSVIQDLRFSLRRAMLTTHSSMKIDRQRRLLRALFVVVTIIALVITFVPNFSTVIALKLGFPDAYTAAGKAALFADEKQRDTEKAFQLFEEGAAKGSANSAWYAGYCYWAGVGTSRDYKTSKDRFTQAGSDSVFLDGPFSSDEAKSSIILLDPSPLSISGSDEPLGIFRLKSQDDDAVFTINKDYNSFDSKQEYTLSSRFNYGFQYILEHSLPNEKPGNASASDYAAAQIAIWSYQNVDDTSVVPDSIKKLNEKANLLSAEAKTFTYSFQEFKALKADSMISVSTAVEALTLDNEQNWHRSGYITVNTGGRPFKVSTSFDGVLFEDSRGNGRDTYNSGDSFRVALPPEIGAPSDIFTIYVTVQTPTNVARLYESKGDRKETIISFVESELNISRPIAIVPSTVTTNTDVWHIGLMLIAVSLMALIYATTVRIGKGSHL